jgi:hypothetical protein
MWYVLEERGFDLMLVNARDVKIVPDRKTDVKAKSEAGQKVLTPSSS